jgi:carboxymethylenebutenolidase
MCELDDMEEFSKQPSSVSRRQFGALALGAGLAVALPRLADAAETKGADVEIKTSDGTCDAYFVSPAKGRHPAVLIWPDIFGLRPTFKEMATRLASSGYSVLVINPFYRTKKAPTAPEHPVPSCFALLLPIRTASARRLRFTAAVSSPTSRIARIYSFLR